MADLDQRATGTLVARRDLGPRCTLLSATQPFASSVAWLAERTLRPELSRETRRTTTVVSLAAICAA